MSRRKKIEKLSELDLKMLTAYYDEATGKLYHGKWKKMGEMFNMKPNTIRKKYHRALKIQDKGKWGFGIMGFLKIFGVSI